MYLTDEQLLLLEQLTYLNSDVADAAGTTHVSPTSVGTVGELLRQYNEEALENLDTAGDVADTYTQGYEWAAVIREIQKDPVLQSLKISNPCINSNGKTAALCFTDPKDTQGQAYVAFRGTLDGYEWMDNVEGLNQTDTKFQKEALAYVEALPYGDITVVGHSKGGNKAQYVAITSDKVTRCVSMDGQGFSREFYEKYWAEVQLKAGQIKNYSLDNDYVHILLFPVPGSQQLFFTGDGLANGLENHSPNSYFHYTFDEQGKAHLVYEDGHIYLEKSTEDEGMIYLHDFVAFLTNVMGDSEKEAVVPYLGTILAVGMSKEPIELGDIVYDKSMLPGYIFSHPDTAATVVAYLFKYIDTYDLTREQVCELLGAFGLDAMVEQFQENWKYKAGFFVGDKVFNLIVRNLKDGKTDKITEALLDWLRNYLKENQGMDIDLVAFWRAVEAKYGAISDVDPDKAIQNATVRGGDIWNFSKEAYDQLKACLLSFEASTFGDVSSWSNFSEEDWYSGLRVGIAQLGISRYANRLTDINNTCTQRIDRVFEDAWKLDDTTGNKITQLFDTVESNRKALMEMARSLSKK